MKIDTAQFGSQDVEEQSVITFPGGLPGFEGKERFKFFHEEGKPTVFWMQSTDDEELFFSVAPASALSVYYEFALEDEEIERIGLTDAADAEILLILRSAEAGEPGPELPGIPNVRANLKAPIVLNAGNRLALQKVLPQVEQRIVMRAG